MRLSEWRAGSPSKGAVDPKVNAVVDPVLEALGTDGDPESWVAWGEEPAVRYTVFAPTPAGLVTCYVRVNVPGEGPRASAKVIRWNRVSLGELAIETQGTHRLLSFQVEGQVLKGADAMSDRIARFAIELFAAVDGRTLPPRPAEGKGSASAARSKAPPQGAAVPAIPAKTRAGGSREAAPPARG